MFKVEVGYTPKKKLVNAQFKQVQIGINSQEEIKLANVSNSRIRNDVKRIKPKEVKELILMTKQNPFRTKWMLEAFYFYLNASKDNFTERKDIEVRLKFYVSCVTFRIRKFDNKKKITLLERSLAKTDWEPQKLHEFFDNTLEKAKITLD